MNFIKNICSYIFYGVMIVVTTQQSYGQCVSNNADAPCCNALIYTDPAGPINNENSAFKNNFDWINQATYQVNHPTGGYLTPLANPFSTVQSYLKHINYATIPTGDRNVSSLDFHPEDGWELIHRNMGYELDEITPIPSSASAYQRPGPYFILYNKYTSIFRVITSIDNVGSHQSIETRLTISQNVPGTKYSASLAQYGRTNRPLDMFSEKLSVSRVSEFPENKGWFIADFEIAYDPCICDNDVRFQLNYWTLDSANVNMEGRLIATTKQLTGSGNSELLNGQDFLLAVTRDNGFTINGGMQTYNNIVALNAKQKSPTKLTWIEKQALDLLKDGLTDGAKSADKEINKFVNTQANKILVSNLPSNIVKLIAGSNGLSLGLGLAAAQAKSLISSITPKESKPRIPNVSFIEGEMALSGTMTYSNHLQTSEINLHAPGGNSVSQFSNWYEYPSYNEGLGLLAVTETPKVNLYKWRWTGDGTVINPSGLTKDEGDQFSLDSLKYVFNPAAGVDVTKTKIFVAFALSSKWRYLNTATDTDIGDFHYVPNAQNTLVTMPTLALTWTGPSSNWEEYITDFVPLECAQNLGAWFQKPYDPDPANQTMVPQYANLRVKLLIYYEFLPNKWGKVNRSVQSMSFPVELHNKVPPYADPHVSDHLESFASVTLPRIDSDVPFRWFIQDTVFTTSQTFTARDKIIIAADISTAPATPGGPMPHVTFRAAQIEVSEGSIIDPSVELIAESQFDCGNPISPISDLDVKTFCQSSKYKADQSQAKLKSEISDTSNVQSTLIKEIFDFQLFPNPGNDHVYIRYTTSENDQLKVVVRTIQGRVVKKQSMIGGSKQVELDINNLSKGVFTVTMEADNQAITKKMVLLK